MELEQKLEEIEKDLFSLVDGSLSDFCRVRDKIRELVHGGGHWNKALYLPSPGIPLLLKLEDGSVIEGVRPLHIVSRKEGDLGYRDSSDMPVLNVIQWSIR